MNTTELFHKKTVFSFEVFPPKRESGVETIYRTLEELRELQPDFISVTYGAGGSGVANATTIDLCSKIKNEYGIETIAHLSCLYNTKESIDAILGQLQEKGNTREQLRRIMMYIMKNILGIYCRSCQQTVNSIPRVFL